MELIDQKKHVLVFIDWFKPAYKAGGPIQSVNNIVDTLNDEYYFHICTSAYDLNNSEVLEGISTNQWISYSSNSEIIYLEKEHQTKVIMRSIIEKRLFDKFYINSVFSFNFALLPLRLLKNEKERIILAPRGMLGSGALQAKSLKKKLFLRTAKNIGLYKGITWHVSSSNEVVEVHSVFGKNSKTYIAPNLPSKAMQSWIQKEKKEKELKLFFISRISPKKNLLLALQLLNKPYEGDISFSIYGPKEDIEYWNLCEKEIDALPSNIKVSYKGVLHPSEVHHTLSKYHFLFLPTLNENYGHVIIESLFASKPVILSDQTPWTDQLKENKCGWGIPLRNIQAFEEALKESLNMGQDSYDSMSKNSFKLALSISEDQNIIKANRSLFGS